MVYLIEIGPLSSALEKLARQREMIHKKTKSSSTQSCKNKRLGFLLNNP